MSRLKLSVAMCTFNGARFLPEQLQSIAGQTRLPDELVISDDGSTDGGIELIESFCRSASFHCRFEVNKSTLGSTRNFEKAIASCNGEVISLADQDDVWNHGKLDSIATVLENDHGVGAVFGDAELIDDESRKLGRTLWDSYRFVSREQMRFKTGEQLEILLKHPFVTGATMAFRSEFRNLILPIPSNHIHDSWIAVLIASVSRIACVETPLMQYRKHSAQKIGPRNDDSLRGMIESSKHAPREYYLGEADRFSEISDRLRERRELYPPHRSALPLIQQKIRHRKARGSFPKSKVLRLPSVLREAASFRYWRYSNGFGSIAKDLLV